MLAQTDAGATLFIVDADQPGYDVVRNIGSMDGYQIGGHGEIKFIDCEVDEAAVLGEVGKGFEYAQERLEPARLSHCMRFIGRASRTMEIVQHYAMRRSSFGQMLSELQQVQIMGALGISDDTPVLMILRELRPFRIYDGASELHRATIARRVFRNGLRP